MIEVLHRDCVWKFGFCQGLNLMAKVYRQEALEIMIQTFVLAMVISFKL